MNNKLQKGSSKELKYIPYIGVQDLGLAVTLLTSGCTLESVDNTNPQKVKFMFVENSKFKKVEKGYLTNSLDVKAREFFDNIRALKNQLHR